MEAGESSDTHGVYPPLALYPGVSRRLVALAVVTPLLSLAVILALSLDGWLTLLLILAVLLGALHTLWVEVLGRAPWSIRSAIWHPDGSWTLTLVSGRVIEARLSPTTFVSTHGVSLVFVVSRLRRRVLALGPDSLDAETLRRLRRRLRLAGARAEIA
jgi:toxin CptA